MERQHEGAGGYRRPQAPLSSPRLLAPSPDPQRWHRAGTEGLSWHRRGGGGMEGWPRRTRTWFGARLRGHPDVRVGPEMPPGDRQAAGTQPPHRWGHAGPTQIGRAHV